MLYLHEKNDFIDAFQIWLLQVKAKSKCLIKVLCADGRKKFIFIKL